MRGSEIDLSGQEIGKGSMHESPSVDAVELFAAEKTLPAIQRALAYLSRATADLFAQPAGRHRFERHSESFDDWTVKSVPVGPAFGLDLLQARPEALVVAEQAL